MKPTNPHIDFANRYAKTACSTLDAFTALWRLDVLLEDLQEMRALLKTEEAIVDRKRRPWFGFEIISYYAIGFVTCLEWHARSRLVDLFAFRPSSIRSDDLKG